MSISVTEQLLVPDVQAASLGDINAFERLIKRCQCSVNSIALSIVKDLDASEDITQQVFIAIWQQLPALQNPASFLPWARQITRQRAFSYLRDNRVRQRLNSEDAERLLAEFSTHEMPCETLEKTRQNTIAAYFIEQLPPDSREIVVLYYREEQNSRQVAELLGLSEASVRKKLQRVRELLKAQMLEKYGKFILGTAPGLGLSTAICSALVTTSPPVAAASAAIASQTSGIPKLALLLGGAMLGALAGVIGVLLGMQQPIRLASSEEQKQQLLRLRNRSVLWVMVSCLLLMAAYELTSSGWAPICAFIIFISGMLWLSRRVWKILAPDLKAAERSVYCKQLFWGVAGSVLGYGAGFAGLIMGLIHSGRL